MIEFNGWDRANKPQTPVRRTDPARTPRLIRTRRPYPESMFVIYIDADACPVKEEVYRVAKRLAVRVVVAANSSLFVPSDPLFELVVKTGFGAVDDWIAETCGPADIVVTADIPLAARALACGSAVLSPKGEPFTTGDIGYALAARALAEEARLTGQPTKGHAPFGPKDRSRFLAALDQMVNKLRKGVA